ncbi:condensation domain-containing protein [Tumebacillus lipolyticus]|uniref:Condensation domain-containing protein n=1 Tax=Tumebacillus lipolyticus TaxID=1280370 RepID=A0ABW5A0P2_9BACL
MKSVQERLAALSPEQRALFEQTLMQQSRTLEEKRREEAIPRRGHREHSRLSYDQERMWQLHQREPLLPTFNVYGAIRLTGRLDAVAMEQAIGAIVSRHEAWRTVFQEREGCVVQVVLGSFELKMGLTDLRSVPKREREAVAQKEIEAEVKRPFDLVKGPLLRVRLIRLNDEEHRLVLTVHHLVTDRVSFSIAFAELSTHYRALVTGGQAQLIEPPLQYADYAEWQRGYLTGAVLERSMEYWRGKLAGAECALHLPTDFPRRRTPPREGARVFFDLPSQQLERLRALGKREGATDFMVLLAVYKALLHRLSGQADIIVGTPIANRSRQEMQGVIGYFMTSAVLRTSVPSEISFRELLARVRKTSLEAFAHQELPFRLLAEAFDLPRDPSRNALFQAMFVYVEQDEAPLELPGLSIQYDLLDAGTVKYDLTIGLVEREWGLECFLEYSPDLFLPETVQRMADGWLHLVEQVAEHPEGKIGAFKL